MGLVRILRGLVLLLAAAAATCVGATERYDYDPLGRLIRYVDSSGVITEYDYDQVGNILAVRRSSTASPPQVTGITPLSLRRGESVGVTITGSGLANVTVQTDDPELTVSNFGGTATTRTFTLTASLTARAELHILTLANALGSAMATITVNSGLPQVFVDPTPLAIPPDGVARAIIIRLSHTDTVDHVLALSASNPKLIVAPVSVTIPKGQLQAGATVTGISAGQATLTLASATLGTTLVPVFITGEFSGIDTSFSPPLGVVLEGGAPASTLITPIVSPTLGVVVGAFIRSVDPRNLSVGTGPTTLTVSGAGLQSAQAVSMVPPTGVTLGAIAIAPDGSSVSVPVTVAANAPISPRRVVVTGPTGAFPAASPDADRINVVGSAPEIVSIDPIFGTQGTLVTLIVRGRNLQDAQSVALNPATGITVGSSPVVTADGSMLTAMVQIANNAPVGTRTVIVTTPAGSSSATPTAANTFSVITQTVQVITPVASPLLGVVLQDAAPPTTTPITLFTPVLGVTLGSVVTSISPSVGLVGETTTLTLQGVGLNGVSAIQFSPLTGITTSTISITPDGRSLTVPVTIEADAPQTLRTLKVLSGAATVPFASAGTALFRVSGPLPILDSLTPTTLQIGQPPVTLTIRGRNLQNTQQVRVVPPDAMSVSVPVVNAAGTEVTVTLGAAAGAVVGPRAVVVVTPGGESTSLLEPQNTLTLSTAPGTTVPTLVSPLLGVIKGDGAPPTMDIGPIVSPVLGVVLGDPNPPEAPTQSVFTGALGVALGPVATKVAPTEFAPGTSGTLTIQGFALQGVTAITANPSTGITLGSATVVLDGTQVSVPIFVADGATPVLRELRVQSASGSIPFADASAARIAIGPGVPLFDSITPIVTTRGTTFTMTIRGSKFNGATAVTATPGDGIAISNSLTTSGSGTQLDVVMSIAPNAPLGSRVIQVVVPGAASSSVPSPANTLTVVSQ